ncbi:MAG: hypothetical protein ABIV50_14320, partial [Opitutus sp.]
MATNFYQDAVVRARFTLTESTGQSRTSGVDEVTDALPLKNVVRGLDSATAPLLLPSPRMEAALDQPVLVLNRLWQAVNVIG